MSQFRVFAEYVVPSVLAYALAGVYAIVDGFFVGHSNGGCRSVRHQHRFSCGYSDAVHWNRDRNGRSRFVTVRKSAGDLETAEKYVRVTWVLLIAASAAVTAGPASVYRADYEAFRRGGRDPQTGKKNT